MIKFSKALTEEEQLQNLAKLKKLVDKKSLQRSENDPDCYIVSRMIHGKTNSIKKEIRVFINLKWLIIENVVDKFLRVNN